MSCLYRQILLNASGINLKLPIRAIELEGEQYRKKEPMKHRFKEQWVMFPTSYKELIWESVTTERGWTKKKVRAKNAKAKKPHWRKKRTWQKRYQKRMSST